MDADVAYLKREDILIGINQGCGMNLPDMA
jgi:hypothetical protein